MKKRYGLGIDAGGTYTDAVIMDLDTGKVVSAHKALTTPTDPSIGIGKALRYVGKETPLCQIGLASLATTFATNAIVENQGAEAGLILIGYDQVPQEISSQTRILAVNGGHTVTGEEKNALDTETLRDSLVDFLQGLDAVAVASFFSVRNPDHELQVAQMIQHHRKIPVVQGHQLSMRLDAIKRAITAWWNARLIPLIKNLIQAASSVLSDLEIQAPLMVVRGDGTLMSAETALDRPVDTLLSGPAASISGARHLAGVKDALIMDMGGTTTDMAILSGGSVAIDPQGAKVGKWKTHVRAARVSTIGVGGDSLIDFDENKNLTVGPRRVLPLCLLAQQHPEILSTLKTIQERVRNGLRASGDPCSFYMARPVRDNAPRPPLPEYLGTDPVSEYLLLKNLGKKIFHWDLETLERQGRLIRSSLTPTDIRVASGSFDFGCREAAITAVSIFADHLRMDTAAFGPAVENKIQQQICLAAAEFIDGNQDGAVPGMIKRCFNSTDTADSKIRLKVQATLTAPIIGVGAPAKACIPLVSRRLGTHSLLPGDYEVSVAVGAIVGMVDMTMTGEIYPSETRGYCLVTDSAREIFDCLADAETAGREKLKLQGLNYMKKNHVQQPLFNFTIEYKKVCSPAGDELFLKADLRLRATGRPTVSKNAVSNTQQAA